MSKPVIFLGDSLTAGNDWGRAFPQVPAKNMGLNGDTWAGVWGRLDEVVKLEPAVVFLQIGINDFLRGSPGEEILAGHLKIWRELGEKSPKSALYIISLLPYMEELLPGLQPNLDIVALNRSLAEEALNQDLKFIDLFSLLADPDHQLPADFTIDGVHLSPAAYRLWEDRLRPVLEPWLNV